MGFLNHPFPKKQRSFVLHDEVLAFFRSYANEYNLNDVIKFQNQVVNVRPLDEGRWEILSRNLPKNTYETHQYDAIFLCNGHYSSPSIPQYDGLDGFNGRIMHSRSYRRPEQYAGKTLLIVGSGPSGRDIMYEIAPQAKSVLLSHHTELKNHNLPANVEECGDVKQFNVNSVQFTDGKERQIDSILFCTGEYVWFCVWKTCLNMFCFRLQVHISIPFDWLWLMRGRRLFCASLVQACHQYQSTHNGHRRITNMRLHNDVWSSGSVMLEILEQRNSNANEATNAWRLSHWNRSTQFEKQHSKVPFTEWRSGICRSCCRSYCNCVN